MSLINITSPHVTGPRRTSNIMMWVVLMTIPGLAAQTWFFGWGNLINVVWCGLIALASEAVILKMRGRPIGFYLRDYSALVTAVLLGLALPPYAPWWVTLIATSFSIVFAKHLYGGMGYNPFNPAMVGYALVLISFPVAMTTTWATPTPLLEERVSFLDTLGIIFGSTGMGVDGLAGATPLDVYKHEIGTLTSDAITQKAVFGSGISLGWEWVNGAFLLGGLILLAQKIIPWQTPVGVLVGLVAMSLIFGSNSEQYTPLSIHLLSGATMLGAFFIATDPVSCSTTPRGRLLFGIGVGVLTYVIRTYGSYPDAIAFSVLLMNFAAPLIDAYTQPRTYGYADAKRGLKGKGE